MNYRTHTGARRGERSAFALLGRRIAAYLLDMLILFGILAPAGSSSSGCSTRRRRRPGR